MLNKVHTVISIILFCLKSHQMKDISNSLLTINGMSLSKTMSDVTYFETVNINSRLVSLDLQY